MVYKHRIECAPVFAGIEIQRKKIYLENSGRNNPVICMDLRDSGNRPDTAGLLPCRDFWWCDRRSRYGTDPISAFYYGWNGTSGSIDPAFYQTLFRGSDHAGIRCDDRAYRFISVRYQGSHVCNCCHFCHNESVGWSDGRI